MDGPIRTSLPPCHTYAKRGCTSTVIARDHHATHTPKSPEQHEHHFMPPIHQTTNQSENHYLHAPPIRHTGWTYTILSSDRYATHTSKWTDQSEHRYLHGTPYAKMEGPIRTSLPACHSIRQNGWTYTILARDRHATHTTKWADKPEQTKTLKWMTLCHSCARPPCKPFA
jgi:hypothetical protein